MDKNATSGEAPSTVAACSSSRSITATALIADMTKNGEDLLGSEGELGQELQPEVAPMAHQRCDPLREHLVPSWREAPCGSSALSMEPASSSLASKA